MTLALWVVQILLALAFARAGFGKVAQPVEKLRARWNWTRHVAPFVIRLVGSLEILGALGLIVPRATGYLPWLTPVAAVGLVLTMIGAILTHVRLHEAKVVGVPAVLLLLSLFIAVGYFVCRVVDWVEDLKGTRPCNRKTFFKRINRYSFPLRITCWGA